MVYDYLITLYKIVAGLVTKERLLYAFLIAFGVYLLWVIFALCFCFQRRFYTKSVKLYNKLRKSDNLTDKQNLVNKYSTKLTLGFEHGWIKFKTAGSGKPSMYLSRNDVLDSEVSGGVLNQGKSFMKSYIWLTTILLLLFNFAFHGGNEVVTFSLLCESLVLPIIYLFVLRIFYYLYTSVKQQIYKLDVEVYYELVDLLDLTFSKPVNETTVDSSLTHTSVVNNFNESKNEQANVEPQNTSKETANPVSESNEQVDNEINLEETETLEDTQNDTIESKTAQVSDEIEETEQPITENINSIKNNIENSNANFDLEKFAVNETSQAEDKETESETSSQIEEEQIAENSETTFGNFDEVLKETVNESENLESEEASNEVPQPAKQTENYDPESELEKFDVFKKKNINVKNLSNEVPASSQSLPYINVDSDYVIKDDEDGLGKRVTPSDNGSTVLGVIQDMSSIKKNNEEDTTGSGNKFFEVNKNQDSDAQEDDAESEGDDPQGGDVITPEKETLEAEDSKVSESFDNVSDDGSNINDLIENDESKSSNENETDEQVKSQTVENVSKEEKVASIVDGFKSSKNKLSTGGVMIEKNTPITRRNKNKSEKNNKFTRLIEETNNPTVSSYTNSFGVPNYDQAGFNAMPQYGYPNQPVGFGSAYGYPNQPTGYNGYISPNITGFGGMPGAYDFSDNKTRNVSSERKKSQAEELASKNKSSLSDLKPKAAKQKPEVRKETSTPKLKVIKEDVLSEETAASKKRGRPKKPVFDEEITINSDREFNEVLARAEKLMRKSEEGLSASQSKRIEKELKMLMDAMNLYKERK